MACRLYARIAMLEEQPRRHYYGYDRLVARLLDWDGHTIASLEMQPSSSTFVVNLGLVNTEDSQ